MTTSYTKETKPTTTYYNTERSFSLLLENGDDLLLENNFGILLEGTGFPSTSYTKQTYP